MSFNRSSMFPSSSSTRRTVSIVNRYSTAGYAPVSVVDMNSAYDPVIITLSGALTAATLKTMLNITGAGGRMSVLKLRKVDATSRTIRMVVTVDGAVAYNYTSATNASSGVGCVLAGRQATDAAALGLSTVPDIVWTTSLKIEIASSLTETDKLECYWLYNTEA